MDWIVETKYSLKTSKLELKEILTFKSTKYLSIASCKNFGSVVSKLKSKDCDKISSETLNKLIKALTSASSFNFCCLIFDANKLPLNSISMPLLLTNDVKAVIDTVVSNVIA